MEIIFKNEPKLSYHKEDQVFNSRRVTLAEKLKEFVASHKLFQDKNVSITFAHKGVSSLIAIVETADTKVILKIPLKLPCIQGEAQFLKVWSQAGVKVPQIIEEDVLGEYPYVMMEFIDAPILSDAYTTEELMEKNIYMEMGKMLRIIHTPQATGFGGVFEGKAEWTTFNEWLFSNDIKERINYVKDHSLLGEAHGSISKAFEILQAYANNQTHSSYCHNDFVADNIFATQPITVFDPNPTFNYGYIDLGRSMVFHISKNISPSQLLLGYFEKDEVNEKVLHASVLLNAYYKFRYWHKVDRTEQIQRVQEYLIQNRHIIE